MDSLDTIICQIRTLSTPNDIDLKKLRDFLRHEHETLKANAQSIDHALQQLDSCQYTLGIAFLLAAQLSSGSMADQQATFTGVGAFLRACDESQAKKASQQMNTICKCYVQMAIDLGQRAMLRSLAPLRIAIEKLRPNAETLTATHAEFLRVCLKAKAYHYAKPVLDQPIFDISLSSNTCTQLTSQNFLCYFYYGALIRIGLKDYSAALQMLLVVLTCPASCLSAIHVDAYKKYVLVSLKVHGDNQQLPKYAPQIAQSYAKSPNYALDIADAFKQGDGEALRRVVDEKSETIRADGNMGLVKQVIDWQQRHKLQTLTKTYLTLSLAEITREVGEEASKIKEIEELLFDMISSGEINAKIDQSSGNVFFEDRDAEMDSQMVAKLQDKLHDILELAQRISSLEIEVVSSEAYLRKVAAMEGTSAPATMGIPGEYDFMDM